MAQKSMLSQQNSEIRAPEAAIDFEGNRNGSDTDN